MPLARRVLVAALLVVPLFGCKKLLGGLKADASDADDASVDAATASAPVADAAPEPSAAASETPADAVFSPPGACIDARADAQKRAPGLRAVETLFDLDGDGKSDKFIQMGIGGDERASSTFVYVMRGTCGVFVGEVSASSVKLTGNRSRGLRSIEALSVDTACTDSCTCKDKAMTFFFNGKVYQASGKPRDVARKCVDGGARRSAPPKCPAGQAPFADDDSSPAFCARSCAGDAECKPARCDSFGFMVDEKTGAVFTGVGKSVQVCGKGASAAAPSAAAASTALAVPPGSPAIIQNPKLLDCPDGYVKLTGPKTCNKSCRSAKCPTGTTCTPPMSVCM